MKTQYYVMDAYLELFMAEGTCSRWACWQTQPCLRGLLDELVAFREADTKEAQHIKDFPYRREKRIRRFEVEKDTSQAGCTDYGIVDSMFLRTVFDFLLLFFSLFPLF